MEELTRIDKTSFATICDEIQPAAGHVVFLMTKHKNVFNLIGKIIHMAMMSHRIVSKSSVRLYAD